MSTLRFVEVGCIMAVVLFSLCRVNVYSEEIYLKNGDKVSGEVIEESEEDITVKTEAMGVITVSRNLVDRISATEDETAPEISEEVTEVVWQREISLGYNKSSGNTENSQLSVSLLADRKIEHVNEITLKGDAFYSSSSGEMDGQKWHVTARHASIFGERDEWYNFYIVESDHDRFANIDYRITLATGIGYWFSNEPDWKMTVAGAIGLEHTDYRDETEDNDEVIIIPRTFFEKGLFGNTKISQDLLVFPTLDDLSEYRLHSETALTTSLTQNLSLRTSVVTDYNSTPPEGTEKRDQRLILWLAYSF